MLYRLLKFLMGYAVRSYFREIQLRNEELVPAEGPVIILPNHRSAFMDPVIVATYLQRRVYFLARGESFKNPVMAYLLRKANVIPIYRRDKSPEDMHKNEEIFKYCYQLLENNGALIIFPEGASQSKPVLLPLKTGAARIALGAEAKNNFTLNVKLLPVGINYTNPHHFQGKLFLNFGNPINAVDFKNEYLLNPVNAVQDLTGHIEHELKKRVVVVDDSRWYDLTDKAERIIQSDPKLFGVEKNEENIGWFMARKDLAGAIDYFRLEKIEILENLERRVQHFFSILDSLNLKESTLNPLGKKQVRLRPVPLLLYFILGFPVFILGFVLHIIPFFLTNLLAKALVRKTDFTGSILLVSGLFLFSASGFTLSWLVFKWSDNFMIALLFFFILPTLGIFTFRYYIRLKRLASGFKARLFGIGKSDLIKKLMDEREELLEIFKHAHEDYLVYRGKNSK